MTGDNAHRLRNLAAWTGGAILCQACLFGLGSYVSPDPAYGRWASFAFGEFFGLGGVLGGLLGYALLAAFRTSSAGAVTSFISGAAFALVMVAASFAAGAILPEGAAPITAAIIWVGLGALSYALPSRMRSNYRVWTPPSTG